MSLAVLIAVTVMGLLLVGMAIVLFYLFLRHIFPRLGILSGVILYFIASSLVDIRYAIFIAIALATMAVQVGGDWQSLASLASVYVLALSLVFALLFGAERIFGIEPLRKLAETQIEAAGDSPSAARLEAHLQVLKFNIGAIAIVGGFAGYVLVVIGATNVQTMTELGYSNMVDLGLSAAFQIIISAPSIFTYETNLTRALGDESWLLVISAAMFKLIIGITASSLLVTGVRSLRRSG